MTQQMAKPLSIASALLLGTLLCAPSFAKGPRGPSQVAVTTQDVGVHEISQSLALVGKLKASQSVIIAPEVSGTIERIAVGTNQNVKTGQVLIRLSDDKAKASVAEAQAYLNDEQRKLNEYERLRKSAAITLTEIEGQKSSVDIAKARLDAAKAELQDRTLRAPFSGQIGFVDFSLGKLVSAGTELLTLDNLEKMELDLQVPERYLPLLSTGMSVSAISNAWGDQMFEGTLVGIDSRVNPDTLNLRVRIDIDNDTGKLKPGMLVQATMKFPPIEAAIIPVQALEYMGTKRFVYVVEEGNKAVRREVFLGTRVENEVVIEKGLEVGETIVVQGVVNMRGGALVKVVGEEESSEVGQ
ncbi:efflux RND transporter periplasmic adaptor subunit [Vibrio breoganii]|uniref:Efflux RND transporter periplasmic adaptor subunit n=1 Tax=Vibrio breoganii TaxID=553239 RepID=A0AAJ3S764_9VIBR|nr:efflux RND transporter periplasmic adaptor subunit [Vibrio breoganii]ANO32450.1 efflux transporter periplasmic adaptor subunit [Vibrio breoganii]MDN3717953.1 efflux RND transporter periplasmic adaptor subunit [Vibrio breoganii]NMO74891.1 efflux RND transporter periplasmic adaptor subunit [Vibrio breoganii]NMR71422.1 efflux RND transporter periplasmic adaptor subunit [Vibrio breoganii]OCH76428.1 efflux transporter periplasmic adaptor subunit [Vibrio breoganii]